MRHVYLAQLKCPLNHCMMAAAGEYDNDQEALDLAVALKEKFQLMIQHGLNPVCSICGARDFATDLGRMAAKTMAEALPLLKKSEADQRIASEMVKRHWRN